MPPEIKFYKDNTFEINFKRFFQGFAPLAHLNSLTEIGNDGHAGAMTDVDIINGDYLTQGPALADLTNGDQAGVVSELINFILDQAVSDGVAYGIGATKLFKITPTTVVDDANWPQAITSCTDGESVIDLQGDVFYFFNKSSGGEIGKLTLPSTFDHDWGSTVPTGAAALQSALHPSAKKEDIMVFGNGRYLGVYLKDNDELVPDQLDFGANAEVADVAFYANQWLVPVNFGVSGDNRNIGQIYLYNGAALTSVLDDEVAIGLQRIGFVKVINGVPYVSYRDLSFGSSSGFKIGYIQGRRLVEIGRFSGSLPTFDQKTLYKSTILFVSGGKIYSNGAIVDELPIQTSQLADGGHATVGALAAPFGTPMVASTDAGSNHRLAKFSGYSTTGVWRSIIVPLVFGRLMGFIDEIIVLTKTLGASARCDLKLEFDQASDTTMTVQQITTTGQRRHIFKIASGNIEDLRLFLDWSNGHASNDCAIRSVSVRGHLVEV